MINNWQIKKLSEICVIKPPKNEARNKLGENELVSFVPMEDLNILSKNLNLKKERKLKSVSGSYTYFADGDVLLAKITPCFENGKLGIARNLKNGVGFGSSEYIIFRPHKDLISEYLFYFLSNDDFRKEGRKQMSGAVGHKRISKEFIENYEIPVPSISEQKRVVIILDEVSEKITKAKENTEKNLQNSKDLFESYLQSVFINYGESWKKRKLGDICGFVRGPFGGSLRKDIFKSEGYAVYEQQHAIYNQFNKIRYFIDEKKFQEMSRFELKPKELIMSCSGTMGKIAIAPENIKRGIINQALLKFNPNKDLLNLFLSYWIKSRVFQDSLKSYSKGAAIKNVVSVKILKEITMFVPPLSEQKSIVAKLDALYVQTKKLEEVYKKKLENLEELKKSVLKSAFAGKL